MPRKLKASGALHLPGTHLEGGGQLVRLAVCLAALVGMPLRIDEIRGRRRGPGGLKLQHLRAVEWLADGCGAEMEGAEKGSKDLVFVPDKSMAMLMRDGETEQRTVLHKLQRMVDIGTPGSVGLVLQAILPYLLFAGAMHSSDSTSRTLSDAEALQPTPLSVTIHGGTNVSNSLSIDYIRYVLLPTLKRIGLPPVEVDVHKRGWMTGGRGNDRMGSVTFTVTPIARSYTLPAWNLKERGELAKVDAYIVVPQQCLEQVAEDVRSLVGAHFGPDISLRVSTEDSKDASRFYIFLVATCESGHILGRDGLWQAKIKAGRLDVISRLLIKQVLEDLVAELDHGGCVDEYLRDQLIVFQALAEGRCQVDGGRRDGVAVEPSLHALTAMWVSENLVGSKFDEAGQCEGVGFAVGKGSSRTFTSGGVDDVAVDIGDLNLSTASP